MKLRLSIALALLAVFAVPAFAADHQVTLNASTTNFAWQGAPEATRGAPLNDPAQRESLGCDTQARPCEEVLIKLEQAGKFTATVAGQPAPGGAVTTDVDAWLYKSDASGKWTQGQSVASGTNSGPDTVAYAKGQAGEYYVLVVDYYNAYGSGYDGVLKFSPSGSAPAPAAPAPGGGAPAPAAAPAPSSAPAPAGAPAPTAKKKASKRAACQKKAKKIKNSKKRAKALKKCKKMKG